MKFLGTKPLETDNCYLRKLHINDAEMLFDNVFADPKVSRYMSWNCYNNVNDVVNYLTKWQDYYKKNECYWGVFLKEDNTLIGTIYLYPENINANLGFISYCFGSRFWGKGFATETVKAVLKYGFHYLEYNNITTFCAKSNYRSKRVLERLGFTCEGIMRMRDKTDFGYEDCMYYSLLSSEFVN